MEARAPSPRRRRAPAVILAEFETAHDILHAAEKVRDAGYVRWDTHTPFPVHGMDRAMGLADSRLGWIVLAFALTGLTGAFVMMHWMNGVDYPTVVGDKPPGAPQTLPSMVPILFELTILLVGLRRGARDVRPEPPAAAQPPGLRVRAVPRRQRRPLLHLDRGRAIPSSTS